MEEFSEKEKLALELLEKYASKLLVIYQNEEWSPNEAMIKEVRNKLFKKFRLEYMELYLVPKDFEKLASKSKKRFASYFYNKMITRDKEERIEENYQKFLMTGVET